jgi:hypothetical protein
MVMTLVTLFSLREWKCKNKEKKREGERERESVENRGTVTRSSRTKEPMSKSTTELVSNMQKKVTEAALQLERRWTYAALRRVSPVIWRALHEQRDLFAEVCVTGRPREIVDHGEATVRGYQAAVQALEAAEEPDDAYMLGVDLVTGLKVAIGQQRAAVHRVMEVHGNAVIWVTPDEVARMLAGLESFKAIGAVKKMFPGAEVIDRYEAEGNLDDSGSDCGGGIDESESEEA